MAVNIAKLAILLTTDTSGMQRGFAAAQGMVGGFGDKSKVLNTILAANAAAFAALSTATVVFVREGIRMAAVLEDVGVQLEVMTGSASKGTALLGDLWALAAETPFQFEDVAMAGKQLLAMGVSSGRVTETLLTLGNVSAGTGQRIRELAQVYGEVQNAGRLTSNELRQFNMRGVPLLGELADMMGVSKQAIREMVEEGKIGADDVERAFQRMGSAGGRFADLMERRAQTLSGQWEKVRDSFSMLAFEGAGGSSGWLKQALEFINRRNNELADDVRAMKESRSNLLFNLEQFVRVLSPVHNMLGLPSPFLSEAIRDRIEMARSAMLDQKLAGIGGGAPDEDERQRDRERIAEQIAEEQAERMKRLKTEADRLTESLRTPGEVMADSMAQVNELLEHSMIGWDTYSRAVEEIKSKFIEATREKRKFFSGANANPAVDFHSSAGAAAIGAAKAEMARMVMEQKESNDHLKKIEAALAGVATF